ncbi:uncharacterized protein BXZ73DRAFT_1473, partial [Epithele typhae]|uniref:uncharacterized protein n=1 Tax=Epithele typhae TaxID=378194 RepID=UPI002007AB27
QRHTEYLNAVARLEAEGVGDRKAEMFELIMLETTPEKQGRGYASALVKALNDLADAEERAVWVRTSDASGFYATLGYVTVAHGMIAEDNPEWDGPPVDIYIV